MQSLDFFSSRPPSSAAPSTRPPLLEPYTSHPTPTLLFFNPHAKGNYFLPVHVQQLLLLLDGLLLLALPFYAIGVTYYWSYHADSGGGVLGALFSGVCGVLHFTVFLAYIVVLICLFLHQVRHALMPQVVASTLSFTYLVSAAVLIMISDGCWDDSVNDRCELAVCCILASRIFLHLCLCLFLLVEYAKHLICLQFSLPHSAHQPSIPLSALSARHPAQEPFPSVVPPGMRYLFVYASGLSEDELSRLDVCEWTKPTSDGEQRQDGASRMEGEDEGEVCSICICGYERGASVVWLPCGHVHHDACIRVWLSLRNVCPDCRNEVFPAAGQQRLVAADGV